MARKPKPQKRRQRGRKFLDFVQRLRAALWYWALRACGFSDYQLDLLLDDQNSSASSRGMNRQRIFETIRRRKSIPGRNQAEKDAFVRRVDACDGLRGTAKIYFSEFWQIMRPWVSPFREARRLLPPCLKRLGLRRLSLHESIEYITELKKSGRIKIDRNFRVSELQKEMLQEALKNCPIGLDLLAVVGILFKESCLAQDLELALIYQKAFREILEKVTVKFDVELREKFADNPVVLKSIERVLMNFSFFPLKGVLRGRIFEYNNLNFVRGLFGGHRFRLIVRKDDPLTTIINANVKKKAKDHVYLFEKVFMIEDQLLGKSP